MAKLKAVITKEEHEKLADALKEFYIERNGTFVLDSDHEDVTGLKNSLQAARAERETAQADLKKFRELGDPTKIAEGMKKVADLEKKELEAKGEYETLTKQLKEKHAEELKTATDRNATLTTDLERLVVDREIISVLSDPDVQGSIKVLLPHIKQRVKAVKEGEQYTAIVHDGRGTPSVKNGQGAPMTIKDLALEMREDPEYAANFKSQARGGSGASGAGSGAGGAAAGAKTVSATDADAVKANFEKIAKGEVTVV